MTTAVPLGDMISGTGVYGRPYRVVPSVETALGVDAAVAGTYTVATGSVVVCPSSYTTARATIFAYIWGEDVFPLLLVPFDP
ncbi:hypothetical protein Tdes44962_MAKER07043 [Teratosphaeria destructans]|uniref:Uncharacterized protein n=1 Tax=Teratosphaeria destructans TaxID=418781 RepID=A0A9W7SZY1_9PEZI|nr:hypothetical protein Tdes44962_MAKER07043 [Teratosphaeria destructans]